MNNPLAKAVYDGNYREVKKLLEAGENPNVDDFILNSPLLIAIDTKNEKVVDLLIREGADVNLYGNIPLVRAIYCAIYNRTDTDTCLRILYKLLDSGIDVNSRDFIGRSVIHHIIDVDYGYDDIKQIVDIQLKLLQIFIDRGIDPNIKDRSGRTALHYYCLEDHPKNSEDLKIAEFLLQNGTNPDIKDNQGNTVFKYEISPQLQGIFNLYTYRKVHRTTSGGTRRKRRSSRKKNTKI